MKSEILVAIVLGLILGLGITYGVYRSQAPSKPESNQLQASPSPNATTGVSSVLVINQPINESIITESEQIVTGTTIPNAFIVIFVNDTEYLTTADVTGNFSQAVSLENGSNVIEVHSLDEDGNEVTSTVTVVRSSASLEAETAEPTASPDSEENADQAEN